MIEVKFLSICNVDMLFFCVIRVRSQTIHIIMKNFLKPVDGNVTHHCCNCIVPSEGALLERLHNDWKVALSYPWQHGGG